MNKCPKCNLEMINMFGDWLCHYCDVAIIATLAKLAYQEQERKIQEQEKEKNTK
jgi:hypothetical protein